MSNIVSILLIVVSFGTFFMYVDPTYTEIKALSVEKDNYTRALDNSKKLQEQRDMFLQKFNAVSAEDRDNLLKLLPDNIDNVRLIIDIAEMAKAQNVPIGGFRASVATANANVIGANKSAYGTLTLSFSTSATYGTFLSFMKDLERSLRILDITSIGFSASDSGAYDYDVTLKTYWLK
ncbi:MAG: type 4a pilus biogenesis protein PilO [Candidatus Paceibacterota bacterium]|jgi:hypothetical protein